MTRITLFRRQDIIFRVEAEGHSGYAEEGADIVCAAVTASFRLMSAQLDAAGLSQKVRQNARRAYLSLEAEGTAAEHIFAGFKALAYELGEEYPENISVTEVEQNA